MAQTRRQAALAAANESPAKRSKTEPSSSPGPKSPGSKASSKAGQKDTKPSSIAVGDALPDADVTLQDETSLNLASKHGRGILVLFAYPKASTPGCTQQTSGFGAQYAKFTELGAAVYGISADSPKRQTAFKEKTGVDFDLISDPEFALLGPLGAKKSPSSVIRSHWVFVDGKAVLVEHSVKPADSPSRTLAAVQDASANGVEKSGDETKEPADGEPKPEAAEGTESVDETEGTAKEEPKDEPNDEPKAESAGEPGAETGAGPKDEEAPSATEQQKVEAAELATAQGADSSKAEVDREATEEVPDQQD